MKTKTTKIISLLLAFVILLSAFQSTAMCFAWEKSDDVEKISYSVTYHQTEARKMLKMLNDFKKSDLTYITRADGNVDLLKLYHADPDLETCTQEDIARPLVYNYALEKEAMQRVAEQFVSDGFGRPDGSQGTEISEIYDNELFLETNSRDYNASSAEDMFKIYRDGAPWPIALQPENSQRYVLAYPTYRSVAFACANIGKKYFWVIAFSEKLPTEEEAAVTSAIDSKTKISCEVDRALISYKYEFEFDSNDGPLKEDSSIAVPKLIRSLYYGSLFKGKAEIEADYTGDNQNAVIKDGRIYGKKAGETAFTAVSASEPLKEDISFSVTIKHNYKLIKHVKATTKKKGKKVYKCTCCGKKKTIILEKLPPTPTNFKLKSTKKNFIASWKKQKNVDFFDIEVKTKGFKMSTGLKASKTKYKQKNLKSGKIYKVRIRAVRYVNGQRVCSEWTKWKKVKIK